MLNIKFISEEIILYLQQYCGYSCVLQHKYIKYFFVLTSFKASLLICFVCSHTHSWYVV